jgi:hypothetical protein
MAAPENTSAQDNNNFFMTKLQHGQNILARALFPVAAMGATARRFPPVWRR